ncbi:MAG TPA: DNA-processing protein DprA [Candidatus Limnocylindrales bacterium]|nr:DNA-processing protein DprA [Candidatus Limnocylindrales bacterium]
MGKVGRGSPAPGVSVRDQGYPVRLQDLKHPPDPVYLAGSWDHPGPYVAIVGARNATEDGIDVARGLAGSLAARGVAVVSGLARGIDAAAHEGALDSGGVSGAVLGTSLDETYPPEHAVLQEKVARSLGLMSEISPTSPATRVTFATRNRLLAAIAHVVVVVQGREKSGSLITAAEAKRLGRPVGAVPWDSRDPLGEAPHALIRAGIAKLVCNADDVLKLLIGRSAAAPLSPTAAGPSRVAPDVCEELSPIEAALYRALRERPLSLDHLAAAASLTASELSVALLALELNGFARRMPGGLARRTRRAT